MRSLIVMVASLLFSSQMNAHSTIRSELTDSFLDVVKSLTEEIKAILENAKKVDQKVKVIAIIPSMTIKEISRS